MRPNHIKKGTIREDGKVYWCYDKRWKNPDVWITQEKFEHRMKLEVIRYKKYAPLNKEKMRLTTKEWNHKNREKCREYCKKWRAKNAKRKREYEKERKIKSPLYGLTQSIRALILTKFREKGYTRDSKIHNILGCSYKEFKSYIESQFQDGMNWENHGRYGWHLDHIIPCASAKNASDIIRLNHYTNYQPLWAKDNMTKGSKLIITSIC